MHMASAISVLFVRRISENGAVPAPRYHQYKCFDHISRILVQSLTDTVLVSGDGLCDSVNAFEIIHQSSITTGF